MDIKRIEVENIAAVRLYIAIMALKYQKGNTPDLYEFPDGSSIMVLGDTISLKFSNGIIYHIR